MRPMASRISQRVQDVPPSGIRKYFDIAATMTDVISLGIGEPDFVTPAPILNAGIASLQRGNTSYTSNAGILELREAIVDKLATRYGGPAYDPEREALVTVGVSEGMYIAFQAILNAGDEVIVPQPCFVAYQAGIILAGGTVVDLPTYAEDDFFVNPDAIEAAITPRTKALLIGFPSNPTGAVMNREGMLKIAAIAEKHDLIVVSDEIYDRLVYDGHEHVMFASLPGMAKRTIHLGGMSKDYAMNRLAHWLCPGSRRVDWGDAQDPPILDHVRSNRWARSRTRRPDRPRCRAFCAADGCRVRSASALSGGWAERNWLDCFTPRGAFYAFPSIKRTGLDEHTFCERLLEEEHVAVIPGSAFGSGGIGHVRLAYAQSMEKIEKALERMHRFTRRIGVA